MSKLRYWDPHTSLVQMESISTKSTKRSLKNWRSGKTLLVRSRSMIGGTASVTAGLSLIVQHALTVDLSSTHVDINEPTLTSSRMSSSSMGMTGEKCSTNTSSGERNL